MHPVSPPIGGFALAVALGNATKSPPDGVVAAETYRRGLAWERPLDVVPMSL